MSVIYMEKASVDALTESDIKKIVDGNSQGMKYQELERYYAGEHRILYETKKDSTAPNNRIVNNMAKFVTDTAVGYFIGKPVIYSSQNEAFLAALQDIFDYNDEQDENTELSKKVSIDGSCFEMLYMDEDAKIRFVRVNPDSLILIKETDPGPPLAAIRRIRSQDKEGNDILKVEYWTSTEVWYFRSINGGSLQLQEITEHFWNDVPFVEYVNNEERIGDFEGIITIIDAYNKAQSNTANLFQYNDDALLKITKLGEVSSQDVANMKEKGAIILDDGGNIDWLIKQIDDTALENHKKRLREDMHIFSSAPYMGDEAFGGNLSGVAVSYKLWELEQICAIKERKFKRGLQRRIELITNMLNLMGAHYDYRDIEMQFRRNKPQNMLEIAQIVTMLSAELSRETRLQMMPNVENVKDEIQRLQEEQKEDLKSFGGNSDYTGLVKALQEAQAGPEPEEPEGDSS